MQRMSIFFCLLALITGCASKKILSSGEAQAQLQSYWSDRIGSAIKGDLIQSFGNAQWCRDNDDGEECRFYKKIGTKWVGDDKKDKSSYVAFDEVVATFDKRGKLLSVQANAQR